MLDWKILDDGDVLAGKLVEEALSVPMTILILVVAVRDLVYRKFFGTGQVAFICLQFCVMRRNVGVVATPRNFSGQMCQRVST